jgi:hypothetical protein
MLALETLVPSFALSAVIVYLVCRFTQSPLEIRVSSIGQVAICGGCLVIGLHLILSAFRPEMLVHAEFHGPLRIEFMHRVELILGGVWATIFDVKHIANLCGYRFDFIKA